jgi:hypothetical protein
VTVSPTRIVSADGAKLNPLISIEWNDDDIGTDVVGATTTGSDVVVDSGADVVVTTAVGLDVVVDAAMVVDVVGVAVDVVVSGAVEVVEAAVELVSATDDVVVTTTVDVVSTAVEETAPRNCLGWHAEKVTTQASEAAAMVRDSVIGMLNTRTRRRGRPVRLSRELTVSPWPCVRSDPGRNRIRLQADALFLTRRNTPCRQHSPARSPTLNAVFSASGFWLLIALTGVSQIGEGGHS